MIAQACRFGAVGVLATLVHVVLGLFLFRCSITLHVANALAFCGAFLFGFTTHYFFTFADKSASILVALSRYFAVAITGYALNGGILIAADWTGKISAESALVLAVALAAILSFFVSRNWAF
ncbi:GtrA family protein [Ruegeria sp. 2205SS24-7]|uniref:GtrA family protein n=1 Tax=Ruegeria discodermiae TaxID=3064389 RepID=UPI002740FD19|nr:GtrA family protein [Ruegeria sp. 2205SS24-7]MDP5218121.1 GtrA family protein [Ruegeria sp. 2205SS24-7]